MADFKKIKLANKDLSYVAFDGTDSIDSAAFGLAIEDIFGVRNLYTEQLKGNVAADDPSRLEDPNHPHLPIWRVAGDDSMSVALKAEDPKAKKNTKLKPIAVICPSGFKGDASDTFPGYDLDASVKDLESIILKPGVHMRTKDKKMALAAGHEGEGGKIISPEILTLSSHGWLGGYMKGNAGESWMIIGGTAKKGLRFEGPVWLILAQCSTVCMATWPSWCKVMANSDPVVRGVLAYEEVAPAAAAAADFAVAFFKNLKTMSFIQAWAAVNNKNGRSWSAIVHEKAKKDSLTNYPSWPKIDKTDVADPLGGVYWGWSQTPDHKEKTAGSKIVVEDPPFDVKLEIVFENAAKTRRDINETNLDKMKLWQRTGPSGSTRVPFHYEVTLQPPLGVSGKILEATIEWVHIRRTKVKIKSTRIFASVTAKDATVKHEFTGTAKTAKNYYLIKPDPAKSLSELVVSFVTQDSFKDVGRGQNYPKDDMLVEHHSYVWIYASMKVEGEKPYPWTEFTTRGLVYNGP
jgi:hypothetical protein